MPLDTSRMYHKGPLLFGDVKQYADLLTGTMTDQPVSIGNNLSVTGNVLASGALKTGTKAGVPVDGDVSSPADGMLRIDTTNNNLYFRSNGQWRLTAGGSAAITTFEATNVTGATVTLPSLPANNGVFEVSVNGQAQQATRDWTIAGQVITFTTALSADDVHVAYVTASTFNTSNYFAHHEVTLATGQSTITLPQTPVGAPSVTRGGVQQYNTAGHYSLAGAVITLAVPIGATEDGRISVDYFVAGGGASDAGSVNGIQVGTPPTPNVLVKTDGAGLLPVAAIPPITSAMITDGTIATADLADRSVTNAKLASDTARANLLVNGGFEVWQRGTSGFIANGAYSADKWTNSLGGASTFSTLGKDTTNQDAGSTADLGFTYSHAVESFIYQKYEDGIQLRGRTITLSIRVKSSVANAVRPFLQQNPGASNTYGTYHTGSGNYETLTVSVTVSGSTNNVVAGVSLMASGVGYLDNAMLVVGSVPADYAPLHPADDLARCLRYYEIIGESGTGEVIVQGYQAAGANVYNTILFKARKAVAPTVTKVGTWTLTNTSGGPTIDVQALDCFRAYVTATAAGYTYATNNGAGQRLIAEANP